MIKHDSMPIVRLIVGVFILRGASAISWGKPRRGAPELIEKINLEIIDLDYNLLENTKILDLLFKNKAASTLE